MKLNACSRVALAASLHARGYVEEYGARACARLKDANASRLFNNESSIGSVARIGQKHRLRESGKYRLQFDTRALRKKGY